MKRAKVIESYGNQFTWLNRGLECDYNGMKVFYSKMVRGRFVFKDESGAIVRIEKDRVNLDVKIISPPL